MTATQMAEPLAPTQLETIRVLATLVTMTLTQTIPAIRVSTSKNVQTEHMTAMLMLFALKRMEPLRVTVLLPSMATAGQVIASVQMDM